MSVTGIVFIAVSLDGYIARKNHEIDWLMKQVTEGEDHGYEALNDRIDGLVMGSNSYKKVLTFGDWPYTKPVVVMSRSLNESDIPDSLTGKVSFSNLPPLELMKHLESLGWKNAYIDGGSVIQSFLKENLIQEMTISTIPILIGSGIPLFGELEADIDLQHIKTETFPSGIVGSTYKVL